MYDDGGAIGFIIMKECPEMAVSGFSGHFFFMFSLRGCNKGRGIAVILVHIMVHSVPAGDRAFAGVCRGKSNVYRE